MALTITEIVVLRDPSLTGDSRLDSMIELASGMLDESVLCGKYNYCVALLVLHWYAKADTGNGAGGVKSAKEGDLAISYNGTMDTSDLGSTGYGQELKTTIKNCVFTPRTSQMQKGYTGVCPY